MNRLWRLYYWIKEVPYKIKCFYQRGKRGYADVDVWNLNDYLASWLPKALRHLSENNVGCAEKFFDNDAPDDKACHKWEALLVQMAEGFEAYIAMDAYELMELKYCNKKCEEEVWDINCKDCKVVFNQKEYDKRKAKFEKGMKIFSENFIHLWD